MTNKISITTTCFDICISGDVLTMKKNQLETHLKITSSCFKYSWLLNSNLTVYGLGVINKNILVLDITCIYSFWRV